MAIQAQMHPDNLGMPLGLGGSQDWLMMDSITNNNPNNIINNNNNYLLNSCGLNEFSFNVQQKLQQQQFQFQQHEQQQQQQQQLIYHLQNLQQRNYPSTAATTVAAAPTASVATTTSGGHHMPMSFSHTLSSQIEKQRQEIDRYISLQIEMLKRALEEQRKQQLSLMLKKVEEKAAILLRQKDEEIAKAKFRTMELEQFTRKMEVENQAWQRLAAENEAMVVSLSAKLEELKEQVCCLTSSIGVKDAESCCNNGDEFHHHPRNRGEDEETGVGESSGETGERNKMMMMCRVCNSRNACILFLPCRHLSSCKACEAFLDSCPLCKSVKRGSIEALIS